MQAQVKRELVQQALPQQIKDTRFLRMVQTIAQSPDYKNYHSIAFVGITRGVGTSALVVSLGAELVGYTGEPSIVIESRELKAIKPEELDNLTRNYYFTDVRGLLAYKSLENERRKRKKKQEEEEEFISPPLLQDGIKSLRRNFDYVLIDCPALNASTDAQVLASLVDGVVLVAEAGRATKEQVIWARRTIEKANGKVMGFMLNKRRYVIPNFIYRWF